MGTLSPSGSSLSPRPSSRSRSRSPAKTSFERDQEKALTIRVIQLKEFLVDPNPYTDK